MNVPRRPSAESVTRLDHRGLWIEAPATWREESLTMIRAPGRGPQPNIVVSRIEVPMEESLDTFASRRVAELAPLMAGFDVIESTTISVAGRSGLMVHLSWDELNGPFVQRLVFFKKGNVIFTVTGSARAQQDTELRRVFDYVIATLRFGTDYASLPA